jgi:hypothetical protein
MPSGRRNIWGRVIPHHPIPIESGFAEFILSPDIIGAEGLRMTSHTPFKTPPRYPVQEIR